MDLAAADDKDSTAISPQETSKPLSKNAQKRQLRQQRNAATRADWKAKVREKKKLRRANRKVEEVDQQVAKPKNPIVQDEPIGEEIVSLVSQICRCYATNRRCKRPFKLTVTGLGGATEQRLATAFPEYTKWGIEFKREPLEEIAVGRQLVYLSADAEETLDEIEPNYSYIIGGLIDRNRHKNIAAQRAKDLQIRSMKLPLSNHIKLKSSQVLTIVHVYDLLCQQRELDSWPEAIRAIIPDRKRSTDI